MRPFIVSSSLIFFLSAVLGFMILLFNPDLTQAVNEQIQGQFQPLVDIILKAEAWQVAIGIFINNTVKALLAIIFGVVFGVYTVVLLSLNGFLLGILGAFAVHEKELPFFLSGILPHGIIEIPTILFAGALGLKLAKESFWTLLGRKSNVKETFTISMTFFWKYIVPLLALAAVIEVFLTPHIMTFFINR